MDTAASSIDTPAILIDLGQMDRNLARVASYAKTHGLRLRPHTKTHKIPALARRQIEMGAAGIAVAKISEAEVMLEAGPTDLLVAYPVIGRPKLVRLTEVAKSTDLTVALDSVFAAQELAQACAAAGVHCGVLAELDVGLHRVGVRQGAELVELVKEIVRLPSLEFRGIAFYPGHIKKMDEAGQKAMEELDVLVQRAVGDCESAGFPVHIVSGGSTPALFESHRIRSLTEIRPGTYIFNDRNTWLGGGCSLEDCAASLLVTVVSTAVPGQIIIDGGSKTFSSDRCSAPEGEGFGYFPDAPGAILEKMNEEHGYVNVRAETRRFRVGEKLRVIPNHICVAMNLHEQVYGIRDGAVESTWKVAGRGKLQ